MVEVRLVMLILGLVMFVLELEVGDGGLGVLLVVER